VSEVQRARLLSAVTEIVAENGYGRMSVARITKRARVSRRTFYACFADTESCFLAALDAALARMTAIAGPPYEHERKWAKKIRAALASLLEFLEREPALARLVFVDSLSAGSRVLQRRSRALEELQAVLETGRPAGRPPKRAASVDPQHLTAEGVLGAVLAVLHARLVEEHPQSLVALLNPMMGMIVLPYLGQDAATRELSRQTPRFSRAPDDPGVLRERETGKRAVEGLDFRITHRTLSVLTAVAEQSQRGSGPSNRQIADAAGITDQGQISRLLARLSARGLVENARDVSAKGQANAWRLTPRGQEIERVVGGETSAPRGPGDR
jgi:AcrR family transcriptional regulator